MKKQEKGITLIALIITIVILIILAGVAISAIENNNIIKYANEATHKFKDEQIKENTIIIEYEDLFDDVTDNPTDKPNGDDNPTDKPNGDDNPNDNPEEDDPTNDDGHVHSYKEAVTEPATCISKGKVKLECQIEGCDYETYSETDTDANNHVGGWTTTQAATCNATGTEKCNGCGTTRSIAINSSNHVAGRRYTYLEYGDTGHYKYTYCTGCNSKLSSTTEGHSYQNQSCTKCGHLNMGSRFRRPEED